MATPVTLQLLCNRPSIHFVGSLNYPSTRHRSLAGHSGVSATTMAAGMRSTCQATARLLKISDLADKAGSVTTWFKTRQSGLRAARRKNEQSYGERVVRESAWCTMGGLAISVGAAGMYTAAAPARCASVPATVHIWVYGRGGPPPPTVYTFIYRSVAICGCVRRLLTNHRVRLHFCGNCLC